MAFESLYDKLQNVFKNLRGKGRLSESDVKAALKEVKMALLEADVSFRVVKQFIGSVQERAVGEDVFGSLTPGQTVIKIVTEELVKLMGSETTEISLKPSNEISIIMMAGLQGAGKTTTTAKIAAKMKAKGRKPLLAACDIYRPAAIEQLQINGDRVGIPVFSMGNKNKPVDIAKAALEHASKNGLNVVILDTAGRLHIDETMMDELVEIKDNLDVCQTILVVDAMTGQDAVNVAGTFNDKIGIDGVILTKLDGDTRGGAALSIRAVTGKPILYVGMGEKLSDLEQFYPDRMASRILGMGDIQSLIEKAAAEVDEEQAKELSQKLRKAEFDYNDFLTQMQQIKKMGGMGSILSMMPGMGSQLSGVDMDEGEKSMRRVESIILSMTKEERANPNLMNPSRKQRIARGAGVEISEVNRLVKQFDQMKKMMKQMPGLRGGGKRKGGFGGLGGNWLKNNDYIEKSFKKVGEGLKVVIDGIKKLIDLLKESPRIQKFVDIIKDIDLKEAGGFVVEGLKKGLSSGLTIIPDMLKDIGLKLLSAFEKVLRIASPSKEMEADGEFVVAGLVKGIENTASTVWDAIKDIGTKIITKFKEIKVGEALTKVISVGAGVGMLAITKNLVDTFKNITAPMASVGEFIETLDKSVSIRQ